MNDPNERLSNCRRVELRLRGVVQGVGFRPFLYNEAVRLGLRGFVINEADAVRVEVQGAPEAIDTLLDALAQRLPPQARIDSIQRRERPCRRPPEDGFEIRRSVEGAAPRPTIPADLATCGACVEEIFSSGARRERYPFTNCTNCGPRWSILRGLPYDRPKTSMAAFAMCDDCRAEYDNPADRRFHAQPIACPACGPRLRLLDASGGELEVGDAALRRAAEALRTGCVVALKGLGGFQLLVDATDADAVERLRRRKRRPDRPFAVLLPSLDVARRHCRISEAEARLLVSREAPIVLLRRRARAEAAAPPGADDAAAAREATDHDTIAEAVAPGNPYLGVMLPYTPLHHLLCREAGRPLVCTSGNLSEEPMATATAEAIERLGAIADVLLTHNRPIVRPVDDSVTRVDGEAVQVLRRARGYAPLPLGIELPGPAIAPAAGKRSARDGAILALGGHLKNAVALGLPREAAAETPAEAPPGECDSAPRSARAIGVVLGAHIGDLDNVRSVEVFRRAIDDLLRFFEVVPGRIACDLHPDYASTRQAEAMAGALGVPLRRVQHHHAHVAACMAEHALAGPVLGLAWDGTGYGPDGTVWGGEALVCEGARFRRAAHLRSFTLPGGDRATREPRRSALGLLYELFGHDAARWAAAWFAPEELRALLVALDRRVNCPRTSSVGRLFDAVAALAGLPPRISFEGQAAMALEFAADADERSAYDISVFEPNGPSTSPPGEAGIGGGQSEAADRESGAAVLVADWEPMIRAVLSDVERGEPAGRVAARFHHALAAMAAEIARRVALADVVLSGGCFQNAVLTDAARRALRASGFQVHVHRRVPPGDGGIALGQVYVAAVAPE